MKSHCLGTNTIKTAHANNNDYLLIMPWEMFGIE